LDSENAALRCEGIHNRKLLDKGMKNCNKLIVSVYLTKQLKCLLILMNAEDRKQPEHLRDPFEGWKE